MRKGFTLIELLVVIAIVCLVATIIAAPIQAKRQKNKAAKLQVQENSLKNTKSNY